MSQPNALSRALAATKNLPAPLRRVLVSRMFGLRVKFAGTGGVRIDEAEEGRAVLSMRNRRRVQNHIGGIHGAAMGLLAESATGFVFGMSLPDSRIPLVKRMNIDYVKRAQGDLRAEATLDEAVRGRMQTDEKGDAVVAVKVTDEAGNEPIRCEIVWAWVPKKR